MGDQIYPGFIIKEVSPNVTEESVRALISENLRRVSFRNGDPEIIICREEDPNYRGSYICVIVRGAMETLHNIRWALQRKKLAGTPVHNVEGEFGIPVLKSGLFKSGFIHKELHDKLLMARGDLEPINILDKTFAEEFLGGLNRISKRLVFEKPRECVKTQALKNCYFFQNCFSNDRAKEMAKLGVPNRLWIDYFYNLSAFQDMLFFNQNPILDPKRGSFVVKVEEDGKMVEKKVTARYRMGISPERKRVDVNRCVKGDGYVPLDSLDPVLFNVELIRKIKTPCFTCDNMYEILGIDANLSWVAGECKCNPEQLQFLWMGKRYNRITIDPHLRGLLNKFEEPVGDPSGHLIIAGVKPMYNSPVDFQQTACQVAKVEFTAATHAMMLDNHVIGTVITSKIIEKTGEGTEYCYHVVHVTLQVPSSKFWSEDSNLSIDMANLIPTSRHPCRKTLTMKEMKADNIRGKFYGIRNGPSPFATVTTVIEIPSEWTVKPKDQYFVIPKPPDTLIKGLKGLVASWNSYDYHQASRSPPFEGVLQPEKIESWDDGGKRLNAWDVKITFPYSKDMEFLGSLLEKAYLGMEVRMNVRFEDEVHHTIDTMRVYDLFRDPFNEENFKIFGICKLHHRLNILPGPCKVEFWCIADRDKIEQEVRVVYEDWECEEQEEIDAFEDDLSDGEDEDDEEDDKIKFPTPLNFNPQKTIIRLFELREDEEDIDFHTESLEEIIGGWRNKPIEKNLSNMQFMLYPVPGEENAVKDVPLFNPKPKAFFEEKKTLFLSRLNEIQSRAVENILGNRVSSTQGPPGTGKTTTASYAVAALHCKEDGVIIVTSTTNKATDVIYDKLRDLSRDPDLGLKMNVMRMYASSREDQFDPSAPLDPGILHHAMRNEEKWKQEDKQRLILKYDTEGRATMTKGEKMLINDLIRKCQKKVLLRQHVICCTVACLMDGRIARLQGALESQKRKITAILVDEASLLHSPYAIFALSFPATRIALLGDFMQLPPMAACYTAEFAGLDISWMEILNLTPYIQKTDVFLMLDTQYRMHKDICTAVSEMTYSGKLKTAPEVLRRHDRDFETIFSGKSEWFEKEHRLYFFQYKGSYGEMTEEKSTSMMNPKELVIIKEVLEELNSCQVPMKKVTVISMYELQVQKIRATLRKMGDKYKDVEVGTCDSYQGQENGVVILSTVRSNAKKNVGFLNSQRRVNVSISRSKEYLIVVGDPRVLKECKIPFWKIFFEQLEKMGKTITMDPKLA